MDTITSLVIIVGVILFFVRLYLTIKKQTIEFEI
jgi:hypothetical protein